MTREEIKDELYRMLSDVVNGGYPKRNNAQRGRYREAVKKAIEALEQEPCDAVSRKEVMNMLHNHAFDYAASTKILALLKTMCGEVDRMPSVIPQYTDAEIQKMQELEQAEIQKAYEIGKAENIEVLDKIRAEIIKYEDDCRLSVDEYPSCKQCTDNTFETIYAILDKYRGRK